MSAGAVVLQFPRRPSRWQVEQHDQLPGDSALVETVRQLSELVQALTQVVGAIATPPNSEPRRFVRCGILRSPRHRPASRKPVPLTGWARLLQRVREGRMDAHNEREEEFAFQAKTRLGFSLEEIDRFIINAPLAVVDDPTLLQRVVRRDELRQRRHLALSAYERGDWDLAEALIVGVYWACRFAAAEMKLEVVFETRSTEIGQEVDRANSKRQRDIANQRHAPGKAAKDWVLAEWRLHGQSVYDGNRSEFARIYSKRLRNERDFVVTDRVIATQWLKGI